MEHFIFFEENFSFSMFGWQHITAILIFLVLGFTFINYAKNITEKKQYYLGIITAFFLCFVLLLWSATRIYLDGFNSKEHLPLHLCNFVTIILPLFAIYRKKWMYEILLFWIFAGTSQAIITPDLVHGFPHYDFLKYFIVHCGLVIFMFYATIIYKFRPTLRSVFKSFLALQFYFLGMLLVNKLLDSNYFFISEKPPQGSLLDYLGPWPYYILVAEMIVLPYFLIIYVPFHFTKKKTTSQITDPNS